tara:strand:- start:316 stop:933 length:618 start_codon:yes stop_codon:yes gene_type:complete
MKKNKSSKSWIIKQHRDPFYKKSKVLGYRSRSAFKLIEINNKFKFIKKSSLVLDLGASPGGWSQVVSKIVKNGKIVAIDIKDFEKINNVHFIKGDFKKEINDEKIIDIFKNKINIVLSDMAANTTGNSNLDSIRTNLLCQEAILFSKNVLQKNGVFVSKVFMGSEFLELKKLAKEIFVKVIFFKPKSSRNESKETFMYCDTLKAL